MVKTLTVDELIAVLTKFPHDTKVFMSIDTEGNGYSTLEADAPDYTEEDKAIILYPAQERLEVDEVLPKWWEAQE